jgi:hypothetical protein
VQRAIHAPILLVVVACVSLVGSVSAQQPEPIRSIVNITGDLYRAGSWSEGFYLAWVDVGPDITYN